MSNKLNGKNKPRNTRHQDPGSWSRVFLFRYKGRKKYAEIFLGVVKQCALGHDNSLIVTSRGISRNSLISKLLWMNDATSIFVELVRMKTNFSILDRY